MSISNTIAESIAKSMLPNRFSSIVDELRKQEAAIALEVYEVRWTAEQRKIMAGIPEKWITSTRQMNVNTNQGRFMMTFAGARVYPYFDCPSAVYKLWPQANDYEATRVVILDADLADRIWQWAKASEDLKTQINAAYKAAYTAIKAANSLKKLIQVWPESEPYARKYMDEIKPQLPAVRPEVLNQLLGLPADADAA